MELIVDNRESDCKYIDKVRLQVANDNELFKLHIIDNESKLYVACNLIAAAKGLNENERDLYYLINLIAKDSCTIPCRGMKDSYHANFDKSESTLNRTIDSLRKKRIISYTNEGEDITINSQYYINKDKIRNSKYIVVDLDTSANL